MLLSGDGLLVSQKYQVQNITQKKQRKVRKVGKDVT